MHVRIIGCIIIINHIVIINQALPWGWLFITRLWEITEQNSEHPLNNVGNCVLTDLA